ncbi:MAG: hypothetical protein KC493_08090 [Bacteriovoracaceae bacterium]|nr:hypothetical protein [Bacteriovoracaceae bacterium]
MKFLVLPFIFFTSFVYGASVAHLSESDVNYFRAANSNVNTTGESGFLEMIFEISGGGGTAESSPHVAYIGTNDTSGADDQSNNNILSNSAVMPNITGSTINVDMRILVSTTPTSGENEIVQVALEDDSSDFKKVTTTVSEFTTDQWRITIDVATACGDVGSAQECTDLISAADGSREETLKFYVYASETVTPIGDTVDPTSGQTGGIFYSVNFSDKIPDGVLTISSITKGDQRLTLNFTGGNSVTNMASSIIYKSIVLNGVAGGQKVQTAGVANILVSESPVREGALDVKNLTNNTSYTLSTSLVNKYQFSTVSSNAVTETPLDIQTLLEAQACYLVTAGFQEKHYVLDYFRSIRDNYLLKNSLGKSFVDYYYQTAPSYAPLIYNSPKLSLIVRSLSFGVYYFLKYFWFLFAGLICLQLFRLRHFRISISS